jgi:RND family efflux transporter MFP subunit
VDDAIAQRNALREQLNTAKARREATGRSVTKTRVVAPIDGEIETQIIAAGDYVKLGDPLFKLVGVQDLRAHLLLPEAAATRIRPGLKVVLSPPAAPERTIETAIGEIKPTVGANNRALDAIVKFRGDGNLFRGGGTVNARIITQARENALMVPEQSVVLRPAGKVLYVVKEGAVEQRVVETGLRQDGFQEITKGVTAGETVAVDGAGFLTQGAAVALPKARAVSEKGSKPDKGAKKG